MRIVLKDRAGVGGTAPGRPEALSVKNDERRDSCGGVVDQLPQLAAKTVDAPSALGFGPFSARKHCVADAEKQRQQQYARKSHCRSEKQRQRKVCCARIERIGSNARCEHVPCVHKKRSDNSGRCYEHRHADCDAAAAACALFRRQRPHRRTRRGLAALEKQRRCNPRHNAPDLEPRGVDVHGKPSHTHHIYLLCTKVALCAG